MDDFQLAYADYCLMFPTLASLGDGASVWLTEYNRVKATAIAPVLVTSTGGGDTPNVGSQRNFDQKTLLRALHARRAALDSTYLTTLRTPAPDIAQPAGQLVRLGY